MSNLTALPAKLNILKGKLKQKFTALTDRNMILGRYKRDELVTKFKVQMVKTKADLERFIFSL
jgi:uncharacterized protein YjbJ (UPF0337 family)